MKKEKELFKKIIGYDEVKKTLERVIDCINNQDKYKKLGCNIPHGLLFYGEPGLGKSTLAEEFIRECPNRKSFIIRKIKSNGSFIDYINKVFKDAINESPSIVLLDDLDKFAEDDDNDNKEEYVAVQSLIDEARDKDVFVIATANNKGVLPISLLRSGRFDIQIKIDYPSEKDSYKIAEYYLKKKKVDKNINFKNIVCVFSGESCASIEKACNQAGIYAGYNNKEQIEWDELLRAALELRFDCSMEDLYKEDKYGLNTAYHEAGHTLIAELLEPKSIAFTTIANTDSSTRGVTVFHDNEYYWDDIDFMKKRVKAKLAGKAATEIVFNKCDTGANSDLHGVYNIVERFIDNYCMNSFNSWIRHSYEASEKVKESKDDEINTLINDYYNEVKELLFNNRKKLDELANKLYKKKILFEDEIQDIIHK